MENIVKKMKKIKHRKHGKTSFNRIVYASGLKALGFRSPRSATPPTAHCSTFLRLLERLRVPLSQPQKRHIHPERYVPLPLN